MGKCSGGCLQVVFFLSLFFVLPSLAADDSVSPVHDQLAFQLKCARLAQGEGFVDPLEIEAILHTVEVLTRRAKFTVPVAIGLRYQEYIRELKTKVDKAGPVLPVQSPFLRRLLEINRMLLKHEYFQALDPGLELALIGHALLNPQLLTDQDPVGVPNPTIAEAADPVGEWRKRFMLSLGQSIGQAATQISYIPVLDEPGGLKRAALAGLPFAYIHVTTSDTEKTIRFRGNLDLFGENEFEFDVRRAANALYWLVPSLSSEFKPLSGFVVEHRHGVSTHAFDAIALLSNHEYLYRALTTAISQAEHGGTFSLTAKDQNTIGTFFLALTQVRMNQGVLMTPKTLHTRLGQLPSWFKGKISVGDILRLSAVLESSLEMQFKKRE